MHGYVHSRVQLLCLQTYLIRDLTKKDLRVGTWSSVPEHEARAVCGSQSVVTHSPPMLTCNPQMIDVVISDPLSSSGIASE